MEKQRPTMAQCPMPRNPGEPVHNQRIAATDGHGGFALECKVCGVVQVPRENAVYRNLKAYLDGELPIETPARQMT